MNIAHQRLAALSIASPRFTSPAKVVQSLLAVQAQDYGQSLWAIGMRTKGATLSDVLEAIETGKILRTWTMRGTIHFVAAEDATWMLRLMTPRVVSGAKSRHASLSLDTKVFGKAAELFQAALAGGKRLTRPAMMQILEDAGIRTGEQRGYHILGQLAQDGLICIGPMDGKRQTFALLREWAPQQRVLSREASLAELARRYFTGHGPATSADMAAWSGLPLSDVRLGLAMAKPDLESETVDGVEYWLGRDHPAIDPVAVKGTYLVAGFDEYVIGYRDRRAILDGNQPSPMTSNGILFPIIVHDGRVIGLWRRTITAKGIKLELKPYDPLEKATLLALQQRAEEYGAFMQMPVASEALNEQEIIE